MSFDEARAQFPVLERFAYLQAGTFGPLARPVVDAMRAEQERALAEGRVSPTLIPRMLELRARVRGALAGVVGVDADRVALTTSTTDGCNVVVNGLGLTDGDEVVTTDAEHFGMLGPLAVSGAKLRIARVRDLPAGDGAEAVLAEVTPRTKLVAVSHVNWITGNALDVAAIREHAGVPVLVDGAQAAGAIPVDAGGVDFYTVSAQKWLCGPDLTGALFVRDPERLAVALPSYLSQQSYDLTAGTWEPQEAAARFDTCFTPLATLAGLEAALELHPEWRFERAREAAARCRALLSERVEVVTAEGQSTLVSFRAAGDSTELVERLFERGVIVRELPGTGLVRASCGWWTSDDDLERLVDALD